MRLPGERIEPRGLEFAADRHFRSPTPLRAASAAQASRALGVDVVGVDLQAGREAGQANGVIALGATDIDHPVQPALDQRQ